MFDEKTGSTNKLMPTQYDLKRLEREFSPREKIPTVFRPIDKTCISADGTFSGTRLDRKGKTHHPNLDFHAYLRGILRNIPESLKPKVNFVPDLRLTLVGGAASVPGGSRLHRLVDRLITANVIVSKDFIVLQDLFSFRKKSLARHDELMCTFLSHAKVAYPEAKIGFECAPVDYQKFPATKKKFDFVILRSSATTAAGVSSVRAAICAAGIDGLGVFCFGASIFVDNELFASTLASESILGFSFYHGDRPYNITKTYYNVQATVTLTGEDSPTRYWPQQAMEEHYGARTGLSSICPCDVCAHKTVTEYFAQDTEEVSQLNLKHKALFVSLKADEQIYVKRALSIIRPELDSIVQGFRANHALAASGSEKDKLPEALQSLEDKIMYLIRGIPRGEAFLNRILDALYDNSDEFATRFALGIERLLREGQIIYAVDTTSGKMFFSLP